LEELAAFAFRVIEEGFFFDCPEDGGSKFLRNVGNKFLIVTANCKSV